MKDMAAHRRASSQARPDHHRLIAGQGSREASRGGTATAGSASRRLSLDKPRGGSASRPRNGTAQGAPVPSSDARPESTKGAAVAELLRQRTPLGRPISSGRYPATLQQASTALPHSASSFTIFSAHEDSHEFSSLGRIGTPSKYGARHVASATSLRAAAHWQTQNTGDVGHAQSGFDQYSEWPPQAPSRQGSGVFYGGTAAPPSSPTLRRYDGDSMRDAATARLTGLQAKLTQLGGTFRSGSQPLARGSKGEALPMLRKVLPHAMQAPGLAAPSPPVADLAALDSTQQSNWNFAHKAGLIL
jgi:hypothetical protein